MQRLTLVEVSASRCRQSTEALGQRVAESEEAQRQHVWEQPAAYHAPACDAPLDPLYLSADGVTVHTRESGWREQCVGAVYTTQPSRQGCAVTPPPMSPTWVPAPVSQQLCLEAQRRGLAQAHRVVFIGDGAQ